VNFDCPNCITPWKCNGPHLEKISHIHYKFDYGYFLFCENKWNLIPFEKKLSIEDLMEMLEVFKYLDE
jgi:hypothetical protein